MANMDGIKKNPHYHPKTKPIAKPAAIQTNKFLLFKYVPAKQFATIAITFIITFALSLATSQGLAAINAPAPAQSQNVTAAAANDDLAIIPTDQPELLTLDPNVATKPGEVYLPKENISLPDPLQQRKEFLEKYLSAKHSPLAAHVDAISEQSQWKLIIAISRAESSFCKHEVTHNCWGIGGAWDMKNYNNYDEAVADVNRILETKYIQAGLNTPQKIVKKYVGHVSPNWEAAVQEELDNLANVQ